MAFAHVLVVGAQIYGAAGLAVATVFLIVGLDRIDAAARGSYAFRLLLVPGIVVLWPLVIARWVAIERANGWRGGMP